MTNTTRNHEAESNAGTPVESIQRKTRHPALHILEQANAHGTYAIFYGVRQVGIAAANAFRAIIGK